MDKIAVIGAGLIGRAWAIVFARAGHSVALYDADPVAMHRNLSSIDASLADMKAAGLDPRFYLFRGGHNWALWRGNAAYAYLAASRHLVHAP